MKELRETFKTFEKAGNYTLDWKQLGTAEKGNRHTQFTFTGNGGKRVHEIKHSDMPAELLSAVRKYRASDKLAGKKEAAEDALKKLLKEQ